MHTQSVLLTALAATVVSANLHDKIAKVAARQDSADDTTTTGDDDDDYYYDDDCLSAIAELTTVTTDFPAAPTALATYLASYVETYTGDGCTYPIADAYTAQFSSYTSVYASWLAGHSADFSAALAQCSDLSTDVDALSSLYATDICSSSSATGGGVASASASATQTAATATSSSGASQDDDDDDDESSDGDDDDNTTAAASSSTRSAASASASETGTQVSAGSAAREVAVVGAVVAGVLGAVMAL